MRFVIDTYQCILNFNKIESFQSCHHIVLIWLSTFLFGSKKTRLYHDIIHTLLHVPASSHFSCKSLIILKFLHPPAWIEDWGWMTRGGVSHQNNWGKNESRLSKYVTKSIKVCHKEYQSMSHRVCCQNVTNFLFSDSSSSS